MDGRSNLAPCKMVLCKLTDLLINIARPTKKTFKEKFHGLSSFSVNKKNEKQNLIWPQTVNNRSSSVQFQ